VPFNIDSLQAAIDRAYVNIKTFENAIANERRTIEEYYGYIDAERRRQANPPEVTMEVVPGDIDDEE
jgi:hypothetical protein